MKLRILANIVDFRYSTLFALSGGMACAHPFTALLLSFYLIAYLVGCGPDGPTPNQPLPSEITERTVSLEGKIRELESEIADEDPNAEADLDRRTRENQEMISALNIEASAQQYTYGSELRMIEFQENHASEILRQEIASLSDEIRALEKNLSDKREILYGLIPPPETEDTVAARVAMTRTQEQLNLLRNRQSALSAELYSIPDRLTDQLTRQIDSIHARQSDLAFMITSVQADMANISEERKRRSAMRETKKKELDLLRQERNRLISRKIETGKPPL